MASQRPNPFGYATPLGEGLSSVFNAFLAAPTQEERAANAAKMYGMQAAGRRDLAAAGYDDKRTSQLDAELNANRSLADLFGSPNYDPIKAQSIAVGGGLDPSKTNQSLLTRQAITPGVDIRSMDPLAYAQSQNAPNTFTGMGIQDATTRRGQDVTAATSRSNNAADNARALQTNAADNQVKRDLFTVDAAPGHKVFAAPGNPIGPTEFEGPPQAAGSGGVGSNYLTPDKTQRGITKDGLTDAVTGKPLPEGTTLGGSSSMGGYTEQQSRDATFAYRMDGALKNLAQLPANFDPRKAAEFMLQDARIPWTDLNVGNAMISPERQRYQQAMREIIAVYLRKDSGAAITPDEVQWYGPMLMPQPFEDDSTVAQKINAINGMRTSLVATSGGAYDEIVRRAADPSGQITMPWLQNPNAPAAATPQPGQTYTPPAPAAPTANAAQLLQDAQGAIAAGADPAAVRARYKQMTGQDMP